jgi:hypothetical protein
LVIGEVSGDKVEEGCRIGGDGASERLAENLPNLL